jgi:hypothetical protein
MWTWSSPVAWAVFLTGAGLCVLLLSVSLHYVSRAVANFVALPAAVKRR